MPIHLPPPERAIVRVVNHERKVHGLRTLRPVKSLTRAAERHSWDQLRYDFYGHASSDGTPFYRRIRRVIAFRTAGEVVAFAPRGSRSRARSVVRMWMRSPTHRRQLLDPNFRLLGVGRVRGRLGSRRGAMVTADFAQR